MKTLYANSSQFEEIYYSIKGRFSRATKKPISLILILRNLAFNFGISLTL
ncbi:hypothetical protein [Bacillus toyonensis]|nr:hypothetical protein [Bacillus toyonensis]